MSISCALNGIAKCFSYYLLLCRFFVLSAAKQQQKWLFLNKSGKKYKHAGREFIRFQKNHLRLNVLFTSTDIRQEIQHCLKWNKQQDVVNELKNFYKSSCLNKSS